ncbi:hypothetical protein HUE58_00225 [Candidatus Ruthia endofausta]|uniref:Uncharacterized protein n=1 Tax=Candidatus Ruthia endofausta TaxID=2738852 RepID=A0A6N0HMV1_9GAMM|nr:hypothetical protein [Candidatus Ruthia endofausta]QKQ23664.1 hypothetical protein HUE58_00225 [Candidatus Ruthia endofausta]
MNKPTCESKIRFGTNLTMPLGNDNTKQQTIAKLGIQAKQAELGIKKFKQNLSSQVLTLNELNQVQKTLTTENLIIVICVLNALERIMK